VDWLAGGDKPNPDHVLPMWPPTNSYALPSVDETRLTNQDIVKLENELAAAITLLQQTQLRITELREGLEQRRAWIAPIRKVPFEVLSEIFIICSREQRFAPVTIAAVCRRWRDTALATPMAWFFIFPYAKERTSSNPPLEYVSTFLQRSRPCLLHIGPSHHPGGFICKGGFNDKYDWGCDCDNVRILFKDTDRIQCLLTGFEWMVEFADRPFSRLERLVIYSTSWHAPEEFSLNISLFPNLWYLDVGDTNEITRMVNPSCITQSQLRHLSIKTDPDGVWFDLINLNSNTLKMLKISSNPDRPAGPSWVIACPELERIFIEDDTYEDTAPPMILEIVAPLLAFCEFTTETAGVQLAHLTDFNKIVKLRTSEEIPLCEYHHIRVLQLFYSQALVLNILDQLEADDSICAELYVIEIRDGMNDIVPDYERNHGGTIQHRIASRNAKANSHIELLVNTGPAWKYSVPEDTGVSSTIVWCSG
jgi:hypothetical protein